MSQVHVYRPSDDQHREAWSFYVLVAYGGAVELRLSEYAREERQTKRHKWVMVDRWSRMDQRAYYSRISAADVPLPDDVAAEAKAQLTFTVTGAEPRRNPL